MTFEETFFKKKQLKSSRLIPFGFLKKDGGYLYRENFMTDSFQAQIWISGEGQVKGRVIDLALDDDYLALKVENQTGPFVSQVREAYGAILQRLAEECFEDLPFASKQGNRLARRIAKEWGDPYDHPFAKHPDYASYRVAGKWYALIFPLKLSQLATIPNQEMDKQVEVINIKVEPDKMDKLLKKEGIYPSYHMSKKSWVSIVLDQGLDDEELWHLVTTSKQLATPKSLSRAKGPNFWLVPANPKYYDVDAEFAQSTIVSWPQKASIKEGDYLAIYITSPIRAVRYICQVVETREAKADHMGEKSRGEMTLKLLQVLEDGQLDAEKLKGHGITNIRSARRMTPSLAQFIEKIVKTDASQTL